jgi:hypothetical protein
MMDQEQMLANGKSAEPAETSETETARSSQAIRDGSEIP